MNEDSREGALNSRLAECQQIYRRLEGASTDPSNVELTNIPQDRHRFFATAIYYLLRAIEEVEHLLKVATLDSALQNIAPRPLQFYREELAPNRERFERLLAELLDLPEVDLDPKEFHPESESNPVWNILVSGLDYWEMDESGAFSQEALRATDRLLYSAFFRPDEWLRNAASLEPILGKAAESKIPGNIRIRLKELYRSFILGNYLAAIALARAILEYSLVDRSTKIGIDPLSEDPRHPNRTRRLRLLVDDASERQLALQVDMEAILDAGNRTLHQKKKDKLAFLPGALHDLAFTSAKSVQRVVEKLYLD